MYKIRRTSKTAESSGTPNKSRWQKYKESLLAKGIHQDKKLERAVKERKRRLQHKKILDYVDDSAIISAVKNKSSTRDWLHKIIVKTQVPPIETPPITSATVTNGSVPGVDETLQRGGYKPVVDNVMPDDTVVRANAPLIIRHPSRIIVAGASGSGKSTWIERLLLERQDCFDVPPKEILWFYNLESAVKGHMNKLPGVQFHKGLPEKEAILQLDARIPRVIVIDDQQEEVDASNRIIKDLFNIYSHHLGVTVIFAVQSLYLRSKHMKSVVDQATYIVHMKSAKGAQQIQTLAGQIYGKHGNRFATWAMTYAFGGSDHAYLVFDMHNQTKGWQRLRAQVFPGECNLLFVKKGTMLDEEFYEKSV